MRDAQHFLAACRLAREMGKPVVAIKLGASAEGRAAATAHTGALAGSVEAFDAYAWDAGVLRVNSIAEMTDVLELVTHVPLPEGSRLGGMTFSGGMRGLVIDAASAHGLAFKPLPRDVDEKLSKILPVGSHVSNPVDGGAAAVSIDEVFMGCVKALVESPDFDMLLFQEELPTGPGLERRENNLRKVNELAKASGKSIAFMALGAYSLNDHSRNLRAELPHLAFLQEAQSTMRALRPLVRYCEHRSAKRPPAIVVPSSTGRHLLEEVLARPGPAALDEPTSKKLLAAYGILSPREDMARSADEAAAFATRIGFPVVAKVVSSDLPHKSDVGGVILNVRTAVEAAEAYRRVEASLAALPGKPRMEGVLIAEMAAGGLELVLGA